MSGATVAVDGAVTASRDAVAEEWVRQFAEGWRAPADADSFADHFDALMTDDVRLIQPQVPAAVGRRAFREQFARPVFALIPDLHATVHTWAAQGDAVLIEFTLSGTLGGRPVSWHCVDRVTLRDGLASERRAYFDPTPLLAAVATRPRAWPQVRPPSGPTAQTTTRTRRTKPMTSDQLIVELPQGPIRYRELGEGAPIVFVHGFLVDGRLWEQAAEQLSGSFRCIVPDWPMGSHRAAMRPDADLSPPGIAGLIADFIAALDLDGVTIVGNDSGGAMSQVLVTHHPERIARLVLTNCDSFDNFPPFPFGAMAPVARLPGGMTAMALPFWVGAVRRATYSLFAKRPIPPELVDDWLAPSLSDPEIKRDARKFTLGIHKRHTLEAAEHFAELEIPVLLAWAPDDRFFKLSDAQRLAAAIPDARLETIPDAKTFVALDQPERLAELIGTFVSQTTAGAPV